jgi:hypothetical protein
VPLRPCQYFAFFCDLRGCRARNPSGCEYGAGFSHGPGRVRAVSVSIAKKEVGAIRLNVTRYLIPSRSADGNTLVPNLEGDAPRLPRSGLVRP